jgi:histidinol-phosphate/aromatic aminotransferase/cobyric acid decarboxylase-like protein
VLLGRDDLTAERVKLVTSERARVAAALRKLGRRVIEGGANFILASSEDPAAELQALLTRGVLVRDLSSSVPGFLRISIGSVADNERLLEAIR